MMLNGGIQQKGASGHAKYDTDKSQNYDPRITAIERDIRPLRFVLTHVMVCTTKKMLQCHQTLSSCAWWDLGTRLCGKLIDKIHLISRNGTCSMVFLLSHDIDGNPCCASLYGMQSTCQ